MFKIWLQSNYLTIAIIVVLSKVSDCFLMPNEQCVTFCSYIRKKTNKGAIRICMSKNRHHNGQKEKVQKGKQRSTKHTYKTKDRVT
jgi:hypothetical protein